MSTLLPGKSSAFLIHHLRMLEIEAQHHLTLYRAHVAGKEQRTAAVDPAAAQIAESPATPGPDSENRPTGTEATLQVVRIPGNSLSLPSASGDVKS